LGRLRCIGLALSFLSLLFFPRSLFLFPLSLLLFHPPPLLGCVARHALVEFDPGAFRLLKHLKRVDRSRLPQR